MKVELKERKKVIMQVAKIKSIVLLSFYILSMFGPLSAQNLILKGVYSEEGTSSIYYFNGNNFNETINHDFGLADYFHGEFELDSDTLTLTFNEFDLDSVAHYEILRKKEISNKNIAQFSLKVNNTSSFPNGNILFLDNKERIVSASADSGDTLNFYFSKFSTIDYFLTSLISGVEVKVPMDSLYGFDSYVEINIPDTKVNFINSRDTIQYLVLDTKNSSINLQLLTTDEGNSKVVTLQKKSND